MDRSRTSIARESPAVLVRRPLVSRTGRLTSTVLVILLLSCRITLGTDDLVNPIESWFEDSPSTLVSLAEQPANDPMLDSSAMSAADNRVSSEPVWSLTAESIFLVRTGAESRTLFFDLDTGADVLNVSDLNFNAEPGFEIELIRHRPGRRFDIEFRYFAVEAWDASKCVCTSPQLLVMNDLYGLNFSDVEAAQAFHATDLHSAELNFRLRATDNVTWLVGFRYLELDELFRVKDFFAEFEELSTTTRNRLYGAQAGADALLIGTRFLEVNLVGKVGVFGNAAQQKSMYSVSDASASAATGNVAFLGEIDWFAEVQLTRRIAARAGYHLIWVAGVALGPDQVEVTDLRPCCPPRAGIDANGDTLFHGPHVGITGTW